MRYNKIASTREVNESPDQQSRFTIVSKELQTTTLSLSTKQSSFTHRYTLREGERERESGLFLRAGYFSEVKQAPSKVYLSKATLSERDRVRAVSANGKQHSYAGLRALLKSIL